MGKKRVRLTVAYDGTNYHGWQLQKNGVSIESVLNEALSSLFREEIKVIGASRTDSGVHALGNIAVFDTVSPMPAEKVSYALNQRLPEDIRIQKSEEVAEDWHPRHCVSRKTYEYRIYRGEFPMPVKRLYAYFTILWMWRRCGLPQSIWWENMISGAFARRVQWWSRLFEPSTVSRWKNRGQTL